jgi:Thiamine pyrophosphate enzyme, C-terminal TPP binding domain
MKAAGILDVATAPHNPDFAKMALAAGTLGLTAETPGQVRPMLVQALDHDGPALVEVVVNRQELAMPPSIERDQVIGFSMYMIKAVLNGRGDELIDLAKTNFGEREWWLLYAGDVADGSQLIQHCPRAPSLPLSVAVYRRPLPVGIATPIDVGVDSFRHATPPYSLRP